MNLKYFVRQGNGYYHKMLFVPYELKNLKLSTGCIVHTSKGEYIVDNVLVNEIYLTFKK